MLGARELAQQLWLPPQQQQLCHNHCHTLQFCKRINDPIQCFGEEPERAKCVNSLKVRLFVLLSTSRCWVLLVRNANTGVRDGVPDVVRVQGMVMFSVLAPSTCSSNFSSAERAFV